MEGVYNFRDIGGFPVKNGGYLRRGLIYRSGQLTYATDQDRTVLAQLGIKTVFDLRSDGDNTVDGPDNVGPDIRVIRAPTMLIEGDVLAEIERRNYLPADFYCDSLAPRAAYHADLFTQILAHCHHPLIIHCSAGKDRTGIVIALLMRLAGVSDADIIANYAETARHMVEPFAVLRREFEKMGFSKRAIDYVLDCSPSIMQTMLNYLDTELGGIENYLLQGGMSAEAQNRLRMALVEI